MLASKKNGEQTRVHNHWLKSTIMCGRCGSRMVVQHGNSKTGTVYPYFFCNGRKHKRTDCQQKSVLIPEVEARVEEIYARISLTAQDRAEVEAQLLDHLSTAQHEQHQQRQQLTDREARLHREQERLLQAHYADAIPLDLLSREQNRITTGLAAVQKELEALARDTATSHAHIKAGLALLEDCAATYRAAPDHIKKLLNQAFFEKILINPESPSRPASSAVQAVEALTPLIGTITAARTSQARPQNPTCEEPPVNGRLFDRGRTDEPTPGIRHAQGFRPATLVELRGFEPLTPSMPWRCATNCATAPHPWRSLA